MSSSSWWALKGNTWCAISLASGVDRASMWDIMLWLAWANANRASKSVWTHVGHQMWPKLVWFAGAMLEAHALSLCKLCPDPLPVLKTKHGFSKRASVTKKNHPPQQDRKRRNNDNLQWKHMRTWFATASHRVQHLHGQG